MKYHAPLDQSCPEVKEYTSTLFDDPMTDAMGAPTDDIMEAGERASVVKNMAAPMLKSTECSTVGTDLDGPIPGSARSIRPLP